MSRRTNRYRAERRDKCAHRFGIFDTRQGNSTPVATVDISLLDKVLDFLNTQQRMHDDFERLSIAHPRD